MAMLKSSVDNITSLDATLFTPFSSGNPNPDRASFFTPEEINTIKKKIQEFKTNPKVRVGGSQLLKELGLIEGAKESLLKHIAVVKEIITPAPIVRTSIADATKTALEQSIKNVAATFEPFVKSNPKLLRTLAESTIGAEQADSYTNEELPLVIATKQVAGIILEPGKVF